MSSYRFEQLLPDAHPCGLPWPTRVRKWWQGHRYVEEEDDIRVCQFILRSIQLSTIPPFHHIISHHDIRIQTHSFCRPVSPISLMNPSSTRRSVGSLIFDILFRE